ncbi:MAG: HAMP domain-containing sensor histidine kinase [Sneathiella sp.]
MIGKTRSIRYQFLLAINVVLIVVLLLFGISFWLEWGGAVRKHTEEIRQNSSNETQKELRNGFEIYDAEVRYQIQRMEQLSLNLSHSDELRTFILKNRIDPLKYLLSKEAKNGTYDFANILSHEGNVVASFPINTHDVEMETYYSQTDNAVGKMLKKLAVELPSKFDRVSTAYFIVTPALAKNLQIEWISEEIDYEFALLTVTAIHSDFGDPVGVLVLGKLFRNLQDRFIGIKERTKIDYSLYTSKYSNLSTGLYAHSPLEGHYQSGVGVVPGLTKGTFFVERHDENMFCREIRLKDKKLVGLECTGMPLALANKSINHIEVLLSELKYSISIWYILFGVLSLILATILSFFLSRSLTRPLEVVTDAIGKLSRNELDIELPKNVGSVEIETISRATEVFKRNIQAMGEVEKKLRDQREEALLSSRVKSQFLGNMGHDLRTPLNAIIGFSEVLKGEIFGKLGHEKYVEYSNDIHFSGHHLLDLINNILVVSSIESGKFTMNESWFYLPDVIRNSVHLHQFLAEQSEVELNAEISEDVSGFLGDPLRFQQILNNLVSNAIKFTRKSQRVGVSCYINANDELVIKVDDTGAGIPKQDLNKIFEPFFLGIDKGVAPSRGTGLGLFLVKSFVDFHDGTIKVESDVGIGTCFTLTFPPQRLRDSMVDVAETVDS